MARKPKRVRPVPEKLESRELLSGNRSLLLPNGLPINDQDHARLVSHLQNVGLDPQNLDYKEAATSVRWRDRRVKIPLDDGRVVILSLYGNGTLKNTPRYPDPGGAINILYDNTNSSSRILGKVLGGKGSVPLRTVVDADTLSQALALEDAPDAEGLAGNRLDVLNLPDFDLVEGGIIVMAGGENPILHLNNIGPNTLINVFAQFPSDSDQSSAPADAIVPVGQFIDGQFTGVGGLTIPGAVGVEAVPVEQQSGFTTVELGIGQTQLVTQGSTSVNIPTTAGAKLIFNRVDGEGSGQLGKPQMFGYDPDSNRLIRFDINRVETGSGEDLKVTRVGVPNAAISLPGNAVDDAGVGLGRVDGIGEVVLVGLGSTVYVYNASTLAEVVLNPTYGNAFTINNLASDYKLQDFFFTKVDGIGAVDFQTYLLDSTGGPPDQDLTAEPQEPPGRAILVDVTESLEAGSARLVRTAIPSASTTPRDAPNPGFSDVFTPDQNFFLASGTTGVAGRSLGFFAGGSLFDTFQPLTLLDGWLSTTTTPRFSEQERQQASSDVFDLADRVPMAMGSLDQQLAIVTGVSTTDGVTVNNISLRSPDSFGGQGSMTLQYATELTGLSEAFYPEIAGSAVINVLGITHILEAHETRGLVFNNIGYPNLISIDYAENSTFIGLPIGHVDIGVRGENVVLLSSSTRGTDQGGVTLLKDLRPVGPLVPPRALLQIRNTVPAPARRRWRV